MPTLDMTLFDWTDYEDMKPVDTWPSSKKKGFIFKSAFTISDYCIVFLTKKAESAATLAALQITGHSAALSEMLIVMLFRISRWNI